MPLCLYTSLPLLSLKWQLLGGILAAISSLIGTLGSFWQAYYKDQLEGRAWRGGGNAKDTAGALLQTGGKGKQQPPGAQGGVGSGQGRGGNASETKESGGSGAAAEGAPSEGAPSGDGGGIGVSLRYRCCKYFGVVLQVLGGLLLGPALGLTTQVVVAVVDMSVSTMTFTIIQRVQQYCRERARTQKRRSQTGDSGSEDLEDGEEGKDGRGGARSGAGAKPGARQGRKGKTGGGGSGGGGFDMLDDDGAPQQARSVWLCVWDVAGVMCIGIGIVFVAIANPPEYKLSFVDVLARFYQLEFLCYIGGLVGLLLVMLIAYHSTKKAVRRSNMTAIASGVFASLTLHLGKIAMMLVFKPALLVPGPGEMWYAPVPGYMLCLGLVAVFLCERVLYERALGTETDRLPVGPLFQFSRILLTALGGFFFYGQLECFSAFDIVAFMTSFVAAGGGLKLLEEKRVERSQPRNNTCW